MNLEFEPAFIWLYDTILKHHRDYFFTKYHFMVCDKKVSEIHKYLSDYDNLLLKHFYNIYVLLKIAFGKRITRYDNSCIWFDDAEFIKALIIDEGILDFRLPIQDKNKMKVAIDLLKYNSFHDPSIKPNYKIELKKLMAYKLVLDL